MTPSAVLPRRATVVDLRRLEGADGLYWLELEDEEVARLAAPGQFAHVLCADGEVARYPGARRAFGFADLDAESGRVAIQFRAFGARTRWLAGRRPGERIDVMMPLGRGYRLPGESAEGRGRRVLLVADATRPAALLPVARRLPAGAPARAIVAGDPREAPVVAERLRELGVPCEWLGRMGEPDRAERAVEEAEAIVGGDAGSAWLVLASGPQALLSALARVLATSGAELQVAVEAPMTCGIGVCLSCTVPGPRGPAFYRRACVEGPVFDAREVAW